MAKKTLNTHFIILSDEDFKILNRAEKVLNKIIQKVHFNMNPGIFLESIEDLLLQIRGGIQKVEAAFYLLSEKIIENEFRPDLHHQYLKFQKSSSYKSICSYAKLIGLNEVVQFLEKVTETEAPQHASLNHVIDSRTYMDVINRKYSLN